MKTAEQLIEELGIQDLDTFMESTDFEQLDELSKKTLSNYLRKNADNRSDLTNTKKDVQSQHKKLMDVEYGSQSGLDSEDRNSLYKMRGKLQKKEKDIENKQLNRQIGHHRAITKLTKESLESLVSAVLDGDQESASAAFNQAMSEKISGRMDSIKQEIASGL